MVTELKTFETPSLIEGAPFAVYGGIECNIMGMPDSEALASAERRLGYVESRWVDYHIAALIAADPDKLTITTATLDRMFEQAEDLLANNYGGYGTILLPKGMLLRADKLSLVHRAADGSLVTVNGTRVAGIAWLSSITALNFFAVGQITMLQGPVLPRIVPEMVLPDGTCEPRRALAERIYVPLIECFAAAGTVTV